MRGVGIILMPLSTLKNFFRPEIIQKKLKSESPTSLLSVQRSYSLLAGRGERGWRRGDLLLDLFEPFRDVLPETLLSGCASSPVPRVLARVWSLSLVLPWLGFEGARDAAFSFLLCLLLPLLPLLPCFLPDELLLRLFTNMKARGMVR